MAVWVRALLGVAFGAGLLWLAIAEVDIDSAAEALLSAEPMPLAGALGLYWLDIALRVFRWRIILAPVKRLGYAQVGQALIVGYAVNNVLPARLGELFRADFVRRRFGVSRSAAIGTIIVERLLDGIVVVGLFVAGLTFAAVTSRGGVLVAAAAVGVAGVVVGLAGIFAVILYHRRLPLDRLPWVRTRIAVLADSLGVVRGRAMLSASLLSAAIWSVECSAFFLILAACDVDLSVTGLWIVVGAASLSTLLPSAPGYIGSFQLAFVLAFAALGLAAVPAVVVATLTQVILLGSVTVIGLTTLAGVSVAGSRATA